MTVICTGCRKRRPAPYRYWSLVQMRWVPRCRRCATELAAGRATL